MEELLPEQKEQLKTWAGQRDAILLEISNLKTQAESLVSLNKLLAASNTEIQTQVQQSIGRLAELDKVEKEYDDVVSGSLTKHLIEKTRLESEVTNLTKIIEALSPQKESLQKDIALLSETFNTINNRVGVLDKVVDHVTNVSEKNVFIIDEMVSLVKKSMQELVDINKKNVAEADMVSKELPRVFFDVKKQSLDKHKI